MVGVLLVSGRLSVHRLGSIDKVSPEEYSQPPNTKNTHKNGIWVREDEPDNKGVKPPGRMRRRTPFLIRTWHNEMNKEPPMSGQQRGRLNCLPNQNPAFEEVI
jgi:hypothetical protein